MSRRLLMLILLSGVAACGGGGNDESVSQADPAASSPTCPLASAWDGLQCVVFAKRSVERMPTPWMENGEPLTLEVVVYQPLTAGPYPTLVYHHGSTGNGGDPTMFRVTVWNGALAKEFNERGYMVLFPQRRGRGQSDGAYEEGLEANGTRYSCNEYISELGLVHALEDVDVITQQVLLRSDVDPTRMLIGGNSRGGILAAAHAARRPGAYKGVINFVGGWSGERCRPASNLNRRTFVEAAVFGRPMLWLYGTGDSFYGVPHIQGNFDAFIASGGIGTLHFYIPEPGVNGHYIAANPAHWREDVFAYVNEALR